MLTWTKDSTDDSPIVLGSCATHSIDGEVVIYGVWKYNMCIQACILAGTWEGGEVGTGSFGCKLEARQSIAGGLFL